MTNIVFLNTSSGLFQGEKRGVRQFLGIPYGEKPHRFQRSILRFNRHPQTIQLATKRAANCPQFHVDRSNTSEYFDEDCLTLNLFLPENSSNELRPILVFSHGGTNQIGSGSSFDGSAIAAIGNIIVITINYRLNIFGFLSDNTEMSSGNFGLYDQLLALEWISINANNIHGDPQRITFLGHSTGAVNALLLAMSKQSKNLIRRVIALSGNPLNPW